MQKRLQKLTIN